MKSCCWTCCFVFYLALLAPKASATANPPSFAPTPLPSLVPSMLPSSAPSSLPSGTPTPLPSSAPSALPSGAPSLLPSPTPTLVPTAEPTALPSLSPSASDAVTVSLAMEAQATSLPTSDDETNLRHTVQSTVGSGNRVLNFEVTSTEVRRRVLRGADKSLQQKHRGGEVEEGEEMFVGKKAGSGFDRMLTSYTWTIAFDVVTSLASTSFATPADFATSLTSVLSTNTFQAAVSSSVPGVDVNTASVAAVVLTRNPSPSPTTQPTAAPAAPAIPSGDPSTSANENGDDDDDSALGTASTTLVVQIIAIIIVLLLCGAGVRTAVYRREKPDEPLLEEVVVKDVSVVSSYGQGGSEVPRLDDILNSEDETNNEGDLEMVEPSSSDDVAAYRDGWACANFLTREVGLDGSDIHEKMQNEAGGDVHFEDLFNSAVISEELLFKIGINKVQRRRFFRAVEENRGKYDQDPSAQVHGDPAGGTKI